MRVKKEAVFSVTSPEFFTVADVRRAIEGFPDDAEVRLSIFSGDQRDPDRQEHITITEKSSV